MNTKPVKNGTAKSSKAKYSHTAHMFNKACIANSKWEEKDDFLDVIYWGRQILGLILGLLWGIVPFRGMLGLVLFCLVSAGIVYYYAFNFQCVDEDDYGGAWEIIKEGFVTSFAGFLVMWIIIYSGLHFDD